VAIRVGGVADNLRDVLSKVDAAALRAGRDPRSVRLVAVSKTVPAERVREAVNAGVRILGENRVQEAVEKRSALEAAGVAPGIEWHLIGTLQKNKARHAVGAFALIHSLDGIELAREIDRQARKRGIVQKVLVEVNVAGESTKHGVRPEEVIPLVKEAVGLAGVSITGLMCIPPFTDDAESSRPHFTRLRELLGELVSVGFPMTELSMGMTQDYEVAVEEGATLVRVGTAIFGVRACALKV
jgi:pyridoxal phosphate enzyme (YggS family)